MIDLITINKKIKFNQNHIVEKKIEVLYRNLIISIPANFICVTIVYFMLHSTNNLIFYWFLAFIFVSVFRLITVYYFYKKLNTIITSYYLFLIGLFLTSILWGISNSLLMPSDNMVQQMIVIVIIAGISAGGIQTLNASLLASLMYLILIIFPLCIWLFFQPGLSYLMLGYAMTVYLIFMLGISIKSAQLLDKILTLGKENLQLIDDLLQSNQKMKQYSNQMFLMNKMTEMLQLCKNSKEGYNIIINTAEKLLAEFSGGLIILDKYNLPNLIGTWGNEKYIKNNFSTSDCWALRKGTKYYVDNIEKEIVCNHFYHRPKAYLCIPIIIQSKIIGTFNIYTLSKYISEYYLQLANSMVEAIQLSLANIKLNETLYEQSIHDPLTGLLNRRYLNETLERELQRCIRDNTKICIAMLDLDFFKKFNDENSHEAGDEVLKFIGELLNKYFRKNDLACRYGGEEFLVGLINSNLKNAFQKLEKMRKEIKEKKIYFRGNLLPPVTISIGIAESLAGEEIENLIHAADKMLYLAKQSGRDRTEIRNT